MGLGKAGQVSRLSTCDMTLNGIIGPVEKARQILRAQASKAMQGSRFRAGDSRIRFGSERFQESAAHKRGTLCLAWAECGSRQFGSIIGETQHYRNAPDHDVLGSNWVLWRRRVRDKTAGRLG
jgi:hypothetical protein